MVWSRWSFKRHRKWYRAEPSPSCFLRAVVRSLLLESMVDDGVLITSCGTWGQGYSKTSTSFCQGRVLRSSHRKLGPQYCSERRLEVSTRIQDKNLPSGEKRTDCHITYSEIPYTGKVVTSIANYVCGEGGCYLDNDVFTEFEKRRFHISTSRGRCPTKVVGIAIVHGPTSALTASASCTRMHPKSGNVPALRTTAK